MDSWKLLWLIVNDQVVCSYIDNNESGCHFAQDRGWSWILRHRNHDGLGCFRIVLEQLISSATKKEQVDSSSPPWVSTTIGRESTREDTGIFSWQSILMQAMVNGSYLHCAAAPGAEHFLDYCCCKVTFFLKNTAFCPNIAINHIYGHTFQRRLITIKKRKRGLYRTNYNAPFLARFSTLHTEYIS